MKRKHSKHRLFNRAMRKKGRGKRSGFEPLEDRMLMSYSQATPAMTLTAPTGGASGDRFGRMVASVGGDLLVAAPYRAAGSHTGAGDVYRYASTGSLTTTYSKAATASSENFGYGIGTGGGQVVIGVPGMAGTTGGAYFVNSSGGLTGLTPSNTGTNYNFGVTVATNGSVILVGAGTDGTMGNCAGAAYLYDMSGNLLCKYYAPTAVANARFGYGVALLQNGNVVISCRADNDGSVTNGGSVYVMSGTATGTCRTALFKLTETTPVAGDVFGYSIATNGNQVAVGANAAVVNKVVSGEAFLFDGTTGSLLKTFTDPAPVAGEQFGSSIALSTDGRVLVGATLKTISGASGAGEAFLFDTATGVNTHTFTEKTPAANDNFAWSLAFSGTNQVLIGSPNATVGGVTQAGAAYVYTIADTAPVANAGSYAATTNNSTVTLNGTATDADGANDIVSYAWDLTGSGVFSTAGANPSFTEAAPGTYPVTLKVTDRAGLSSTSTAQVTFNDVAPTVNAGSNQTVGATSTVSVSGTASGPSGSAIASYAWDFNYNGSTFNGTGSGASGSTSYATPGTYTVALKATDVYGLSTISTITVTVTDVPPTLSFYSPATGSVGSAVGFSATVGGPMSTANDTISWTFGDGGSLAAQSVGATNALTPTYVFATAGTFTVTATVTDNFGGVTTATQTIVIS